jgi:hypothetical protein
MDNKNNKTIKSNENKVKLLLKKNKDSSNNNNNINKSKISRTVLLTLMGLIIISGIVLFYFVFYKNDTTETYKVGYSYTPKDITNIDINPPVDVKLENIDKCIEACELNGNCSGVTFNKDTYKCKGYKNGMLVKTTPNMYSWEKSRDKKSKVSQMILLTNTYQQTKIDSGRMAFPYTVYDLNFSFWLKIIDWYNSSHSYWKCVFVKTSTQHLNNSSNKIIETSDWVNIVNELPEQCIGVWLSPFTNNLRICVTTEKNTNDNNNKLSFPHPNKQICINNSCLYTEEYATKNIDKTKYVEHIKKMNSYIEKHKDDMKDTENPVNQGKITIKNDDIEKKEILMEHFDILNVPINEPFFISVNIKKTIMEIYKNGKLHYIVNLEGKPLFNNNDLNIKNEPTFNGNIYNVSYLPYFASFKEIENLYKIEPPK